MSLEDTVTVFKVTLSVLESNGHWQIITRLIGVPMCYGVLLSVAMHY
jgi:hypothetical protein